MAACCHERTRDRAQAITEEYIPIAAYPIMLSITSPPLVSKQKAELVYYRALTKYLTAGSQFLDERIAVVQAAADLYGATEIQAAKTAFDQVEIYDGTNTQPNIPAPVAGSDWMHPDRGDHSAGATGLYMVRPATSPPPSAAFHGLNTTFALRCIGSRQWFYCLFHRDGLQSI
jgi:hypothetical protein